VYLCCYLVFVLISYAVFAFGSKSDYNIDYYLSAHVVSLSFIALLILLSWEIFSLMPLFARAKRFIPSVISAAMPGF
jgi:exosortase/archaeosortase